LNEIDANVLLNLNVNRENSKLESTLFNLLHLIRINLYPDSEDFAIWDYSLGEEITQYLIVLKTNINGKINSLDIES
jgi:hypothetical protein